MDVVFPVQLSEFIKSVKFGSNLKKIAQEKTKNLIFHIKIDFYD